MSLAFSGFFLGGGGGGANECIVGELLFSAHGYLRDAFLEREKKR